MLPSRYEDSLAREILRGQRLRATILACVLLAVAALLGLLVQVDARALGRDVVPGIVPVLPLLLATHQVALRWYIGGRLAGAARVPAGFWYLNTLVEISSVSLVLVVVAGELDYPVDALLTPPAYVYFVFVILSTLLLDFRVSAFTGALAGTELVALYFLFAGAPAGRPSIEPLLDTPLPYLMKGVVLLASGLAAGFVARELRERIFGAVASASRRERSAAFLASMSHEIRTPLNAIVGYAELLEKDGGLDAEHGHAVTTMKASGDHLLGVVNQVLDLSRIEAGREDLRATDFDLGGLAAEMTAMFELPCRRAGLSWRATVEPSGVWVRGDVVRLRQVLINLLANAVRFTTSGRVELSVWEESPGRFRFEVADTGPGIPPEEQARVFEPFRTDDRGLAGRGSGLGLAIAYAQVGLMGGRLELDAAPGRGSRFFFTLALEPGDPASAAFAAPGDVLDVRGPAGRPLVAVVADPSDVSRELLAGMLTRVGVDVREAATAERLRQVVPAASPDVVFVDPRLAPDGPASLPGATDGPGPRLVAVSSSALAHERRRVLDQGYHAFLARPIATTDLYDCLAAVPGARLEREPAEATAALAVGGIATPGADAFGDPDRAGPPAPLPTALWSSLRGAAEGYNVTDLRKQLTRLEDLGEGVRPLAEELRRLTRTYDMESIRAVLDRVPHE